MTLDQLFSLAGRTALVTGATRGIGEAMAQALDAAGAQVILAGRDRQRLDQVASTLQHDPVVLTADLQDPDGPTGLAGEARASADAIDILINNAGGSWNQALSDVDDESWARTIQTNLTAAFALTRELAPAMAERGWGRVVNVASVMGLVGDTHSSAYAASKGGMIAMTRSLAAELGRRGVTVNTLCPGWVETDLVSDLHSDERFQQRVVRRTPVRRWGVPADMAAAAVFLSGPGSAFMTGQTLVVDGGLSATW
ncbi:MULTISPECIES: SDR family NAD(P)-dependent oxidoreductase [Nocardioides]|uniref:SDR family NAD(P)-dependent oxidoreductase n=1 Tax=Nocardioides TaxID=1839 RepID=UPI0011E06A3F|nr:SDR family oxidoreductase [Nocardioides caldifontis]